jgi:hypothetical protein
LNLFGIGFVLPEKRLSMLPLYLLIAWKEMATVVLAEVTGDNRKGSGNEKELV